MKPEMEIRIESATVAATAGLVKSPVTTSRQAPPKQQIAESFYSPQMHGTEGAARAPRTAGQRGGDTYDVMPPGAAHKQLWREASKGLTRIRIQPDVMNGMPTICGTRIRVSQVLSSLSEYGSVRDVIEQYSNEISVEDIREAIAFAARLAR